ncbi:hypothetical protein VP01_3888g3 [Puccinia sorghi]|uniref:CCHC-type domain-containing protein n=1 Tax=Puccinia sorghi TaxID=27349 RepID=A0A0L6UST7_9BASI|nr:hypothetical protein VP01_3888g3 [Puccinia sorghi]
MDSNQQDQSEIIEEQKVQISEIQSSMREMKEMMAITVGLETTIQGIEDSIMDKPVPKPESSHFKKKEEIKLPNERKGIMLDTKKVNLHFDGSEVEIFIKCVEKVASMHGAGGQDVALQLPFMIKDRKISKDIENMEYTEKGGIQTKEEYRTFISDLEEILAYLKKMKYKNVNADTHNKNLQQKKERKGLIPKLEKLKDYVEASLSMLALRVRNMVATTKLAIKRNQSQLQEEINNLRTELNTIHNTRALPPNFKLPRQPAVGLRTMGGGSYQRPQIQCYYCKEAAHMVMFCPHLTADLEKKLLFKQGPKYYSPHQELIPTDTGDSIQDLFSKRTANSDAHKFYDFNQQMGDATRTRKSQESGHQRIRKSTGKTLKVSNKQPLLAKKRRPSYPGAWVDQMIKVATQAGIWSQPRTHGRNLLSFRLFPPNP